MGDFQRSDASGGHRRQRTGSTTENVCLRLKEVAGFFDDVAKRIKSVDPLRLVNSGGSNMRESQWHLYLGQGWKKDSFEDQFKCFELLYANSAVDVIDIHSYPNNKPGYLITRRKRKRHVDG